MKPTTDEATFLAVALAYGGEGAPRVVASGEQAMAARIAELARQHDIPVVEDYDMIGLLSQVPLGEEIPEALFVAVAEVLAYVLVLGEGIDEPV
ncbi:MAG: EscU/YscU/HrcU family type III secretion system export apparatus switch protein [Parahaliea sp.]